MKLKASWRRYEGVGGVATNDVHILQFVVHNDSVKAVVSLGNSIRTAYISDLTLEDQYNNGENDN